MIRATVAALALIVVACGSSEAEVECPEETRPLNDAELDYYRQLEVCAGRVEGVEIHRPDADLPRIETDPELVECDKNQTGTCVVTPAGQSVTGFYLPDCDTIAMVLPEVIYHEALHSVLTDVPGLEGDANHTSATWTECLQLKGCPDGRVILDERVCDGTADCSGGEDELGCE